jgi:hypothetical protein
MSVLSRGDGLNGIGQYLDLFFDRHVLVDVPEHGCKRIGCQGVREGRNQAGMRKGKREVVKEGTLRGSCFALTQQVGLLLHQQDIGLEDG